MKLKRQAATKRATTNIFACLLFKAPFHSPSPAPLSPFAIWNGRTDGQTDSLVRSLHFLLALRRTGQDFS